jgi:hypothetical protein
VAALLECLKAKMGKISAVCEHNSLICVKKMTFFGIILVRNGGGKLKNAYLCIVNQR